MSETTAVANTGVESFAFADPVSVIDRRELFYYIECWNNGRYYEPPVPLKSLARILHVSAHHSSAITVKRNLLIRFFRPTQWMDRETFSRLALDFLVMGNAYVEQIPNMRGGLARLRHALALFTRRGIKEGQFWFLNALGEEHEFAPDSIVHVMEPDVSQEIYGLPEYLGALQSGFLNEAATLFRRRYYLNGSHAGFIFYLNEPTVNNEDADAIRTALRESKGVGNFRNLFINAPGGKEKGVQIIPIGEAAAKDEFLGIKNTTRDDILAAHRVPPQLLGVVPTNSGGFGDVGKAADVFFANEIVPLQMRFMEINERLGFEAVAFDPYVPVSGAT